MDAFRDLGERHRERLIASGNAFEAGLLQRAITYLGMLHQSERFHTHENGTILLDRPCYAWNRLRSLPVPTREAALYLVKEELGIDIDLGTMPCRGKHGLG